MHYVLKSIGKVNLSWEKWNTNIWSCHKSLEWKNIFNTFNQRKSELRSNSVYFCLIFEIRIICQIFDPMIERPKDGMCKGASNFPASWAVCSCFLEVTCSSVFEMAFARMRRTLLHLVQLELLYYVPLRLLARASLRRLARWRLHSSRTRGCARTAGSSSSSRLTTQSSPWIPAPALGCSAWWSCAGSFLI